MKAQCLRAGSALRYSGAVLSFGVAEFRRWSTSNSGPLASIHHETPANRPVLRLHLVTPAERSGPIVEVSIAKWTVVDKPDNHGSVRTRTNHGVSQLAVKPPHSPHDRRLVIHQSHRRLGHGSPRGKRNTSATRRFLQRSRMMSVTKFMNRKTKVAASSRHSPMRGSRCCMWRTKAGKSRPRTAHARSTVEVPNFRHLSSAFVTLSR